MYIHIFVPVFCLKERKSAWIAKCLSPGLILGRALRVLKTSRRARIRVEAARVGRTATCVQGLSRNDAENTNRVLGFFPPDHDRKLLRRPPGPL